MNNIKIKTNMYVDDNGQPQFAAYISSGDITITSHGKTKFHAKIKLLNKIQKMMRFMPKAWEALALDLGVRVDCSKK